MMISALPSSGGGSIATTYEQVRGQVLDGTPGTGLVGLILVVRNGLAAWMALAATRPVVPTSAPSPSDRRAAPALESGAIPTALHADLIAVLATMAMATLPEVPS